MMWHVMRELVARCANELESLGRDTSLFANVLAKPFERRSHADAVADLHDMGHPQNPDAEIDWAGEAILSRKASRPFFITDYPKGSRGFYDRESPQRPGVLRNFDLLAPEGYGELIGGSQRIHDLALLEKRIAEHKLPKEAFDWYVDLRRYGTVPHSGFGLGVERTVAWISGSEHIRECIPFPRMLYKIYP
jgi:asparaginyl-tRNA synthetase